MKRPRRRLTIRRMMVAVALVAVGLSGVFDRANNGHPFVIFHTVRYIVEEPLLLHPTKLVAIRKGCLILEDGRVIRLEEMFDPYGLFGFEGDSRIERNLDVATEPDGTVTVHASQATFWCDSGPRPRFGPIRIPLFVQTRNLLVRRLVGTGVVVAPRDP